MVDAVYCFVHWLAPGNRKRRFTVTKRFPVLILTVVNMVALLIMLADLLKGEQGIDVRVRDMK
jgi:hypothetical protein